MRTREIWDCVFARSTCYRLVVMPCTYLQSKWGSYLTRRLKDQGLTYPAPDRLHKHSHSKKIMNKILKFQRCQACVEQPNLQWCIQGEVKGQSWDGGWQEVEAQTLWTLQHWELRDLAVVFHWTCARDKVCVWHRERHREHGEKASMLPGSRIKMKRETKHDIKRCN